MSISLEICWFTVLATPFSLCFFTDIVQIFPNRNASLVSKIGLCPPYFGLPSEGCAIDCRDDSQCAGDSKCCFAGCGYTCTPAIPISTVKPGQCPVPQIKDTTQDPAACQNQCSSDLECDGSKKCCGSSTCFGSSCVEPTGILFSLLLSKRLNFLCQPVKPDFFRIVWCINQIRFYLLCFTCYMIYILSLFLLSI